MSEIATKSILTELVSGVEGQVATCKLSREAEAFLAENGIPSKRHENWKYTNIKRLFDNGLTVVKSAFSEQTSEFKLENTISIGLTNDAVTNQLPSIDGVEVFLADDKTELLGSTGIHQKEELAALNTALFQNALVIRVKKGAELSSTILLNQKVELKDNQFANSRVLIIVEDGATATFLHHYHGTENSDSSLLNHVTEVFVGQNARLELNYIQEIGEGNLMTTTEVECQRDANFTTNCFQLNGKLLRNNLNIRLKGENIETHLNGFYMLNGTELFDNHTHVDHFEPNCNSNEIYRGILARRSTGVFNGKVFVHRDAQKTNGYQSNNNILLSDDATMNSKPELEIYADDVKCSHGSTTGQLDEDAVFYLRARGLDEFGATALLLTAFAGDVLNAVSSEMLRSKLEHKIQDKLNSMRA
jgi:Fe-S cluster assembly protein SufD